MRYSKTLSDISLVVVIITLVIFILHFLALYELTEILIGALCSLFVSSLFMYISSLIMFIDKEQEYALILSHVALKFQNNYKASLTLIKKCDDYDDYNDFYYQVINYNDEKDRLNYIFYQLSFSNKYKNHVKAFKDKYELLLREKNALLNRIFENKMKLNTLELESIEELSSLSDLKSISKEIISKLSFK